MSLLAPGRTLVALGLLLSSCAAAQEREEWRAMNRPIEPFRIAGPLYYVGASDVTSFLITTPEGHILIDGGFVETAPLILESIASLGFTIGDVRILLNSHAHFDHAGGLAALKAVSGAKLWASEREAPLLERGGLGDDLLGDGAGYPPVAVDRRLADGDRVELGGIALTARLTPGHTRGCTSWEFEVRDGDVRYRVVSVCSLSILPDARLVDRPTYPGIADDYARALAVLEGLRAEIFLASHGSFFELEDKRARLGTAGATNPFVDPEGYRRYLARARSKLAERLAAERASAPPR
jgi:metallo-beta-lactamase class B